MKLSRLILTTCVAVYGASVVSCDDATSSIGNSLITDRSEIVIDSTFTVSGESKVNADIQSRTTTQLLGSLNAKEYGTFSSEIVTQFMPALQLDTVGVSINDIDSIKMLMFYTAGNFTGDSLVPMGLQVYPLIRQLPSPIYSDFDPTGYYDDTDCWSNGTHIYTGNALYNDSINNLTYRTVAVKLPKSFALEFYQKYLDSPETFSNPDAFARFFPGLYIKNSFGSGRVINFSETRINLYFRRHGKVTKDDVTRDTIYNTSASYMAVSPEVISNNIIRLQLSQSLRDMADQNQTILVAPAGYDIQLTFPTREILKRYRENAGALSVINTLTLSLPVEKITNRYNIAPPSYLLLVLSKDKAGFFAQNKITDNKTSFFATYNEYTKTYDFTDMRQYILDMLAKDNLSAEDYTFTLTPVNIVTESSSSDYYYGQGQSFITEITPYVSGPTMCRLKLDEAKIKFTYSKQSVNN